MTPELYKIIVCPICLKRLVKKTGRFSCDDCGRQYEIKDHIPILLKSEINDLQIKSRELNWKRKEMAVFEAVEEYEKLMARPYFCHLKAEIYEQLKGLALSKNDILEVGAGISLFASQFSGKNLILTDINYSLLQKNEASIPKVLADAEYLPFADQSFDFIYGIGLIHHLPNQKRGLKELKRLIKPGGQIFLSEPTQWSLNLFFYLIRRVLLKIFGEKLIKKFAGCGTPYESFIDRQLVKKVFKDDFEIKARKILPCRWPPLPFLEKIGLIVPFNKFWQKVPLVRNFGTIVFITLTRKKYYGV